jgi:Vitamin K-dependent gamma-carboxylase
VSAIRVEPAGALRALGWSRAALGFLLVVRTTPLINRLPVPLGQMATPLLGWPEHGFRAAWGGLKLPDSLVMTLCVVRTLASILFALGVRTRIAGMAAIGAAFVVLSQDAFGFSFTLYTLFVGTWLLAIGDGGSRFALRPSAPRSPESSVGLVHSFVASVYAWSAIAKLRGAWLTGRTLRALHEGHFLAGPLADTLFATPSRCAGAAWCVVIAELALGPLLLVRRTRMGGLLLAAGMHATYEWTAHPDVFGWVMAALLISFVAPNSRMGERKWPVGAFLRPHLER